MTTVTRRDNESIEDALKRFKRELRKVGVLREAKKHEHYEKPSEIKKRKKAEMARNKGRRADYYQCLALLTKSRAIWLQL